MEQQAVHAPTQMRRRMGWSTVSYCYSAIQNGWAAAPFPSRLTKGGFARCNEWKLGHVRAWLFKRQTGIEDCALHRQARGWALLWRCGQRRVRGHDKLSPMLRHGGWGERTGNAGRNRSVALRSGHCASIRLGDPAVAESREDSGRSREANGCHRQFSDKRFKDARTAAAPTAWAAAPPSRRRCCPAPGATRPVACNGLKTEIYLDLAGRGSATWMPRGMEQSRAPVTRSLQPATDADH